MMGIGVDAGVSVGVVSKDLSLIITHLKELENCGIEKGGREGRNFKDVARERVLKTSVRE
jgi:hypothetical protein